jgi:hypothetical protein
MFDYSHKNIVLIVSMVNQNDLTHLNNGADFLKWKEMILFMIEINEPYHALYEEAPKVPAEDSVGDKEKYLLKAKVWERSDHFSLFVVNYTISIDIKNAIPDSVYAKDYLSSIAEHFKDV